jgi:hypothetical protein
MRNWNAAAAKCPRRRVQHIGAIIDKNWITEMWAQLALHKANLQVKRLWTPENRRIGNTAIMEHITASGLFITRERQEINSRKEKHYTKLPS